MPLFAIISTVIIFNLFLFICTSGKQTAPQKNKIMKRENVKKTSKNKKVIKKKYEEIKKSKESDSNEEEKRTIKTDKMTQKSKRMKNDEEDVEFKIDLNKIQNREPATDLESYEEDHIRTNPLSKRNGAQKVMLENPKNYDLKFMKLAAAGSSKRKPNGRVDSCRAAPRFPCDCEKKESVKMYI
ncbi:unnamed protein product [Caenorhabditis angaria]|uniref:Uncharacterized protein n=1 Tax=Caenorhabditis angaria TaxID=860376 RepID=A0A9P1N8T6_9PELO|nr:unnamed protein product [Caenorhabditis angaria]